MVDYRILPDEVDYITFTKVPHVSVLVSSSDESMGWAETSHSSIKPGDTATIKAYRNPGYMFDGWYVNGQCVSTENPYYVEINENSHFDAKFSVNNDIKETVDMGLSVKWASYNVGALTPESVGDYFMWGMTVPSGGAYNWDNYTFDWQYVGTLPLDNDAVYQNWGGEWRMPTNAEFEELRKNSSYSVTERNGVKGVEFTSRLTGHSVFFPYSGYYQHERLQSYGNEGHYWLADNDNMTANNQPWITPPNYAFTFRVEGLGGNNNFEKIISCNVRGVCPYEKYDEAYRITISTNTLYYCMASVSSSHIQPGESVVLTATPDADYYFDSWTVNGKVVSTDNPFTTIPTGSTQYVANFKIKPTCFVYASTNYSVMGSVERSEASVIQDRTVTLTATPKDGYKFVNWTVDGEVVSTENPYVATITETSSFVANFDFDYDDKPEAVDLGLPSGTKWASCNIGATAPEEYGYHFLWGETSPRVNLYGISNYYNENPEVLPLSADAANVIWGGDWRMPTAEDCQELIDNCTRERIIINGIKCLKVTATAENVKGNYIILPLAPFLTGAEYRFLGSNDNPSSVYWTSTNTMDSADKVNVLYASYSYPPTITISTHVYDRKSYGHCIRPVMK